MDAGQYPKWPKLTEARRFAYNVALVAKNDVNFNLSGFYFS